MWCKLFISFKMHWVLLFVFLNCLFYLELFSCLLSCICQLQWNFWKSTRIVKLETTKLLILSLFRDQFHNRSKMSTNLEIYSVAHDRYSETVLTLYLFLSRTIKVFRELDTGLDVLVFFRMQFRHGRYWPLRNGKLNFSSFFILTYKIRWRDFCKLQNSPFFSFCAKSRCGSSKVFVMQKLTNRLFRKRRRWWSILRLKCGSTFTKKTVFIETIQQTEIS